MRRALICTALLVMMLSGITGMVTATPDTPVWGTEVNPGECDKVGGPVVNVHQHIVNSVDSGLGGYWAFIDFTRQIQVWASSAPDTYCATVQYQGSFDAQAGQASPGNTGILNGDEDGTFQGGYRATVTGTLLANPLWSTQGNVGTTDYMCNLSGICPGAVNWLDQYFAGWNFSYDWWGWTYRAGSHGTWTNTSDGNFGDIN